MKPFLTLSAVAQIEDLIEQFETTEINDDLVIMRGDSVMRDGVKMFEYHVWFPNCKEAKILLTVDFLPDLRFDSGKTQFIDYVQGELAELEGLSE